MPTSLSHQILKRLLIKLGLRKQSNRVRKDIEVIPIQSDLELIEYWKVLQIGKGPALILQARGKEILKFDCFGKDDGHFHAAPEYGKRIFFKEETARDQIRRSASELKENAQFYLNQQEDMDIRNIKINQEKLAGASDKAKKKMIFFLEKIPELEKLR